MSFFRKLLNKERSNAVLTDHPKPKTKNFHLIIAALVYIALPMICIISAGVSYEIHSHDAIIYQPQTQQPSTWFGSFFFSAPEPTIIPTRRQCPRPLHLWLAIAGICFLFNVPIVYLYKIQQKMQKKQEKGIILRLKNSITSHTKKTLICTSLCIALIVQPLNFATSVVGFVWLFRVFKVLVQADGTQEVLCDTVIVVLSTIQCLVSFLSIFLHIYIIVEVVQSLKRSKKEGQLIIDMPKVHID